MSIEGNAMVGIFTEKQNTAETLDIKFMKKGNKP